MQSSCGCLYIMTIMIYMYSQPAAKHKKELSKLKKNNYSPSYGNLRLFYTLPATPREL